MEDRSNIRRARRTTTIIVDLVKALEEARQQLRETGLIDCQLFIRIETALSRAEQALIKKVQQKEGSA